MKVRMTEQLKPCRRNKPKSFRWQKRQTSKSWRRAAKADPELAPVKRPTGGWFD